MDRNTQREVRLLPPPGLVFLNYGFKIPDLNLRSRYNAAYLFFVLIDKSYIDFKNISKDCKLQFTGKKLYADLKGRFRRYFKKYLREQDPNTQTILDYMDDVQDKWDQVMQTIRTPTEELAAKYINTDTQIFTSLFLSYFWLNIGSNLLLTLHIEKDKEIHNIEEAFSQLICQYMCERKLQSFLPEFNSIAGLVSDTIAKDMFEVAGEYLKANLKL